MLTVYAVSDSIGETAEQVAKATVSQFNVSIEVKRVPYIKTIEDVSNFVNGLNKEDDIMVISNIVILDVREFLVSRCIEKNIRIINILGPCISMLSNVLNITPVYEPGAVWNIDEGYYKKIEAMNFAVQYDDSKNDRGILNADVVIVGLSRTSKSVLCMYLANKGIRAINVPLVPEVPLPDELFQIDKRKIIVLTINPLKLIEVRKHRLEGFNAGYGKIDYANDQRILDELEYYDKVKKTLRCKIIDVTDRAIEDTAAIIMETLGGK